MKNKYLNLIHRELDGELVPSERTELNRALKKDPELKKYRDELIKMNHTLNQIPPLQPSQGLKERIIDSINFNRYKYREHEKNWVTTILGNVFGPRYRLAYGLVAGIFIGMIVSFLFMPDLLTPPQTSLNDLYGTIGIHESELHVLQELSITQNTYQGSIKVKSYWNIVGFEITFKTAHETEIQLEYNKDLIVFRGITTLESERSAFESSDNLITLTSAQEGNFLILFEKLSKHIFPLTLKINQNGKNIFTQTFTE